MKINLEQDKIVNSITTPFQEDMTEKFHPKEKEGFYTKTMIPEENKLDNNLEKINENR